MSIRFDALYYQDPYCREFEAEVRAIETVPGTPHYYLELDRSAFYPEGGGQPGDRGKIDEARVLDTRFVKGKHVHVVDQAIAVGTKVKAEIDWERRFSLMQQHSGEHIISGLAKKFYACENVGFHVNDREMQIDFDRELTEAQLEHLEREANEIIWQNIDLQVLYPEADELDGLEYRSKKELSGQIRLIHLADCDLCACCGTHLYRSGEIGLIKIVSRENYKGGVRLFIHCGRRAREDYAALHQQANELSRLISAKRLELSEKMNQIVAERDAQKQELKLRARKILDLRLEMLPKNCEFMISFEAESEKNEIKDNAKYCTARCPQLSAFFAGSENEGDYRFVLCSEKQDMTLLLKSLQAKFELRAGGNAGLVQGQIKAEQRLLRDHLHEWLQSP